MQMSSGCDVLYLLDLKCHAGWNLGSLFVFLAFCYAQVPPHNHVENIANSVDIMTELFRLVWDSKSVFSAEASLGYRRDQD